MLIKSSDAARRDRLNAAASAAVFPVPREDVLFEIDPEKFEKLMEPIRAYVERSAFRSLTAVDRQREVPDVCQEIYLALITMMMRRGPHPARVDGRLDDNGDAVVTSFASAVQLKTNNLLTNYIRDLVREGLIERLPASESSPDREGAIPVAPDSSEAAPAASERVRKGSKKGPRRKSAKYQYRHREHLTGFDPEGPDAALICQLGVPNRDIENWEQAHLLEQLMSPLDRDDRRRLKFWISCECNEKKYARATGIRVKQVRDQIGRIITTIRTHHKITLPAEHR